MRNTKPHTTQQVNPKVTGLRKSLGQPIPKDHPRKDDFFKPRHLSTTENHKNNNILLDSSILVEGLGMTEDPPLRFPMLPNI